MKVYICWTIPEYIGCDIEAVFLNEQDAVVWCEQYRNDNLKPYGLDCGYDEFEVK